jgi:type VI secretion system protein ImpK
MDHTFTLKRTTDLESSFLMVFFEEFYERILMHLQTIDDESYIPLASNEDDIPAHSDSMHLQGAQNIYQDLSQLLELQMVKSVEHAGGYGADSYKNVQYIMAVFADEIFIHLNWPGRIFWEENLLESRLFGTHDGGDLFFKGLDDFLKERNMTQRPLGDIYLFVLGLGFKGKYRGTSHLKTLENYRRDLFIFLHHKEPRLLKDKNVICPYAYGYTLEGHTQKSMLDYRFWTMATLGILGLLFISSSVIWWNLSQSLGQISNGILENSRMLV